MTTRVDSSGYWHDTGALADGDVLAAEIDGQCWHLSWHSPAVIPDGRNEGSSGICVKRLYDTRGKRCGQLSAEGGHKLGNGEQARSALPVWNRQIVQHGTDLFGIGEG